MSHDQVPHSAERLTNPRAGKEVSQHVLSTHVLDSKRGILDKLSYKEILDIDVSRIGTRRSSAHKSHGDGRCIVLPNLDGFLRHTHPDQYSLEPYQEVQAVEDTYKFCFSTGGCYNLLLS